MAHLIDLKIDGRVLKPEISSDVYLAPSCTISGDVKIGEKSSVWFNTSLRGDVMPIEIGRECNIQDNAVIHGQYKKCGTKLGDRVSVAHSVVLHGTTIASDVLIGMGSIVMDLSEIGSNVVIAAGSLVTEKTKIPSGVLVLGRPAKAVRDLKPQELEWIQKTARNYQMYKSWYPNNPSSPVTHKSEFDDEI